MANKFMLTAVVKLFTTEVMLSATTIRPDLCKGFWVTVTDS